jgi:hypothetical protein
LRASDVLTTLDDLDDWIAIKRRRRVHRVGSFDAYKSTLNLEDIYFSSCDIFLDKYTRLVKKRNQSRMGSLRGKSVWS